METTKYKEPSADHKAVVMIPPSSSSVLETFRYYDRLWPWEDTIVRRRPAKEEIIESILSRRDEAESRLVHPSMISIHGDSGIGKTTLARLVCNDARIATSFGLVLWALASEDLRATVIEIIRSADPGTRFHPLRSMDTASLKRELRGILQDQKYLLVLDDLRMEQRAEWEELRELLELGSKGSVVMLENPPPLMEQTPTELNRFRVLGLAEDESWSLFTRCTAFDDAEAEPRYRVLESIEREIVAECGGNPFVTKVLGSTLHSNRDEDTWREIVESGSAFDLAAALRFGFRKMPNHLMQCFRAYVVFPYRIVSREQLVCLWMAQGLLQSSSREGNEEPWDVGNAYCNELLLRGFLQLYEQGDSPSNDTFRMHDEVHKLAKILVPEESEVAPSEFPVGRIGGSLLWKRDQTPLGQEFSWHQLSKTRARSFFFKHYVGHVTKPFLEGLVTALTNLRVLFLDHAEFEGLPESIGSLQSLRYLSLANNRRLQVLPMSTSKLANLQTLDLSGCEQLKTPPTFVVGLRHLLLSVKVTKLPNQVIHSWLSLCLIKICSCQSLESLPEEIAVLTNLRVLRIHDCPSISSLPNAISCLSKLEELSILSCRSLDLTRWVGLYGLRRLRFLQLQGIPKLRNFPKGLHSARHSLRHLFIRNCLNLIDMPTCLHQCNNLLQLVISGCPNITALPSGVPQIKTLKVLNCPGLIGRQDAKDTTLFSCLPKIFGNCLSIFSMFVPRPLDVEDDIGFHTVEEHISSRQDDGLFLVHPNIDMADPQDAGKRKMPHQFIQEGDSILPPKKRKTRDLLHRFSAPVSSSMTTFDFPSTSRNIGDQTITVMPSSLLDPLKYIQFPQQQALFDSLKYTQFRPPRPRLKPRKIKEQDRRTQFMLSPPPILINVGSNNQGANDQSNEIWSFSKGMLFLLGEGCEFEKEHLIQLWMAAGFIKDEPMEMNGAICFEKLVSEGYILLPSDSSSLYKVNDDKVKSDLDTSKYLILESTTQHIADQSDDILHVSMACDDSNDAILMTLDKFKDLRTLMFHGSCSSRLEQAMDRFLSFKSLSILDLSGTDIKELPSSVGKMAHLRYLDLSWTLIELLPESMSRLRRLQTLKLKGCSRLRRLPRDMKMLTELRHLDLNVLGHLSVMPEGLGVLRKLQTLSAFIAGTQEGFDIREMRELNNLKGEFCIARLENVKSADDAMWASIAHKERLTKLELRWSDFPLRDLENEVVNDSVIKHLCPHSNLEELQIKCYAGTNLPSWVADESFHKLARITLFKCEHVSLLPSMQKLPSLEYLELISFNGVIEVDFRGETGHVAFPKLQRLIVDDMLNLESWAEAKEGDFPCLVELVIKYCPKLLELPSLLYLSSMKCLEISNCPQARFLPDRKLSALLEVLIVEDCPLIKESCLENGGQEWEMIKHVPKVWIDQEALFEHTDDDSDYGIETKGDDSDGLSIYDNGNYGIEKEDDDSFVLEANGKGVGDYSIEVEGDDCGVLSIYDNGNYGIETEDDVSVVLAANSNGDYSIEAEGDDSGVLSIYDNGDYGIETEDDVSVVLAANSNGDYSIETEDDDGAEDETEK